MKRGKRSFQLDHEQEYDQYELDNGSNPNPPTGGGNLPSLGELEKLIEEGKKKVETATSQGVENLENTAKEETKKIQDVIAGGTDILKKSTEQLNELSTQLEGALTQHAQEKIGKIDEAFLTQKTQIGESINKGIENIKSTAKAGKDAITQLATTETEKLEQLAKKKADEVVGAFDAEKKEIKDTLSTGKDEITQLITTGKEEIELADRVLADIDSRIGEKTLTFDTIDKDSSYEIAGVMFQDVAKKGDKIIFYGDFNVKGLDQATSLIGSKSSWQQRIPLPSNIEFDYASYGRVGGAFRPKIGQTIDGVSYDNALFYFGWNGDNAFGGGIKEGWHFFEDRIKQVCFLNYNAGTDGNDGSRSGFYLLNNGDLYASGLNGGGVFGIGNQVPSSTFIKIRSNVERMIGANQINLCLMDKDGAVYMAGTFGNTGGGDLCSNSFKRVGSFNADLDTKLISFSTNGRTNNLPAVGFMYIDKSNLAHIVGNNFQDWSGTGIVHTGAGGYFNFQLPQNHNFLSCCCVSPDFCFVYNDGDKSVYKIIGYGYLKGQTGDLPFAEDWEILGSRMMTLESLIFFSKTLKRAFALSHNVDVLRRLGIGSPVANELNEISLPKWRREIKLFLQGGVNDNWQYLCVMADGELFMGDSSKSDVNLYPLTRQVTH